MQEGASAKPDNIVAKSGIFQGMSPIMAIASMVMIISFVDLHHC